MSTTRFNLASVALALLAPATPVELPAIFTTTPLDPFTARINPLIESATNTLERVST